MLTRFSLPALALMIGGCATKTAGGGTIMDVSLGLESA